jgi:hypothetical protein
MPRWLKQIVLPDWTRLIEKVGLKVPIIGFYDAPDATAFDPLVAPKPGKRACVFTFYRHWLAGKTPHLTKNTLGCPGAGQWLFGVVTGSREESVRFLVDEEGLKASHAQLYQWLDHARRYSPEHARLVISARCATASTSP